MQQGPTTNALLGKRVFYRIETVPVTICQSTNFFWKLIALENCDALPGNKADNIEKISAHKKLDHDLTFCWPHMLMILILRIPTDEPHTYKGHTLVLRNPVHWFWVFVVNLFIVKFSGRINSFKLEDHSFCFVRLSILAWVSTCKYRISREECYNKLPWCLPWCTSSCRIMHIAGLLL